MECIEQFRKACGISENKECFIFKNKEDVLSGYWVYALVSGENIMYVGSSGNLLQRFVQHKKDKVFDAMLAFNHSERRFAYWAEDSAISKIKPIWNKNGIYNVGTKGVQKTRTKNTPIKTISKKSTSKKYMFDSMQVGEVYSFKFNKGERDGKFHACRTRCKQVSKDGKEFKAYADDHSVYYKRLS